MEDRITKEQTDALSDGKPVVLNMEQAMHIVKFLPHSTVLNIRRVPESKSLYTLVVESHDN